MKRKLFAVLCGGIALALILAGGRVLPTRAADQAKDDRKADPSQEDSGRDDLPLRDFMRQKLEASNMVLEGLCTDDFDMVKEGATRMNSISNSERWRVMNDAVYRQFSGDFQATTQQLVEAAEKENMDRATLKWVDATMSCIECHNFVRGIMVAEQPDSR
ncbi:MAG: hypothetical protein DWQ34_04815 [Planctomycetota bacterium]|nr:MAG: hypothetical protein DWQ29_04115 [Planctomycetota bacterium]REJ96050.1 MAG: hypothetical protein DWQ34_04815 [Planctomycetota bacterium]REK27179.1 MAG: hypothetical protein DWQ41_07300 [Planctomycetota bacterium]REK36800.1 MAG: hypothetical protein DWQ45_09335 [Planctomycetota bacterium]